MTYENKIAVAIIILMGGVQSCRRSTYSSHIDYEDDMYGRPIIDHNATKRAMADLSQRGINWSRTSCPEEMQSSVFMGTDQNNGIDYYGYVDIVTRSGENFRFACSRTSISDIAHRFKDAEEFVRKITR